MSEENASTAPLMNDTVDPKGKKFPHCIVWSPIRPATWFFPFVGHMAIGDMEGNVYDFQHSFYIGKNHLLFGDATRYIQLDPKKCVDLPWDEAVNKAIEDFQKIEYSVTGYNCHSFVAQALNHMKYDGKTNWDKNNLLTLNFFHAKFCSFKDFLITFLPFILIIAAIIAIVVLCIVF